MFRYSKWPLPSNFLMNILYSFLNLPKQTEITINAQRVSHLLNFITVMICDTDQGSIVAALQACIHVVPSLNLTQNTDDSDY
jgi:hypothetical protein